jgi:hypothetical protein
MGKWSKRRTRSHFENGKTKGLINKPQPKSKNDDPKKSEHSLSSVANIAINPSSPTPGADYQEEHPRKTDQHSGYRMRVIVAMRRFIARRFMVVVSFLDKYNGAVTALATVAIVMLTFVYVTYSKKQWETMQDTLKVSQGAYVAIGRKDGVVAEFYIPREPRYKSGIMIYFHNSGHLSAKFNWGVLDIINVPPTQGFPPVTSSHKFYPMTRTRNRKTGSTQESGATVITGDSVFGTDIAELPTAQAVQLLSGNQIFMVKGAYEYCDDLGSYSCRLFDMLYQGPPFDRFTLGMDYECPFFMRTPELAATNIEQLPPCQSAAERETERQQQDHWYRGFQKEEAAKKSNPSTGKKP